MNKIIRITMLLATTCASAFVHAEDGYYAGAGIATIGDVYAHTPAGRFQDNNNAHAFKAYAGYDVSDTFAIEAGYNAFGKYKFSVPGSVDFSGVYVAAKGSIKLGESWSLFGKAGVSHVRVDYADGLVGDRNGTRPLLGIGAGYRLTEHLGLSLELVDYGKLKADNGRFAMRQVEANVTYRF
jgi:hypothetical protein